MTLEPKIPVGISACVLGQEVRYNGGHKRSRYCTDVLSDVFDYRPYCPEVAIGLGIPRPTIRLVGDPQRPRVVGSEDDSLDVTDKIYAYSEDTSKKLSDLCGYIFIKNSPSCGAFKVKVYNDDKTSNSYGYPQQEPGTGVFAHHVMKNNPLLPVEEEGRLNDPPLRENFILRVFALYHWKHEVENQLSAKTLVDFHSRYKYTLMAQSQKAYRSLGQLVANHEKRPVEDVADDYIHQFMTAMQKPASRKNHCNTLYHILGYLKRTVESEIRHDLIDVIDQYRLGSVHLAVPVTMLKHYVNRYGNDYIRHQAYLDPYPLELGLRNQI
ncbi:YbgA family protein [Marinibactrum halimedae]|uniref:DUF1722 domain-containing protein n=1 Tax=Marinibactrum halimedae TaxID=1444977 RepID=A0AA37T0Y4_9GAMM|nr:DUF523 and DUF1722 domain-containing protein [Marinibactrum halimedae]MCD9457712.1 DUF523 and DUF1722 domain-containing protein [Marinibactrum halimedae]GLS24914.1 hypothetical protein GCM10007877_06280 [Marinibactrum halimedae]